MSFEVAYRLMKACLCALSWEWWSRDKAEQVVVRLVTWHGKGQCVKSRKMLLQLHLPGSTAVHENL